MLFLKKPAVHVYASAGYHLIFHYDSKIAKRELRSNSNGAVDVDRGRV
jgi:hypothetical protein